ncbi:MAG: ABC transporter ATP-binding protein, partial [Desulfobacterales bacterium]
MNAVSVVAVAPITDLLMGRTGENVSKITLVFKQAMSFFHVDLNLLSVFLFFGGISVVNGITIVATNHAVLRIKYDVLFHLLTDTLNKFFRARFLFFSQGDMGVLLNTFQQETGKIGDTFGQIAQFLSNLLQAIIFLMVPLALSPKLTFIFLTVAIVVSMPVWPLRRLTYDLGKRNTETANKQAGVLFETFSAAKLTIGFGRQKIAAHRYSEAFLRHSDVSIKFQTLQKGIGILFLPLGIIAALVALYSAHLDGTPLNEMTMVLFAFIRLMPIISQLMQGKTSIEGFVPAYEQLERLRLTASTMEEPPGDIEYKTLKNDIQFKDVSFCYPDRKSTLKGIDLVIKKGRTVALVGPSGSGKSTIVDLILGLFQQKSGLILLDGIPLENHNINTFRDRVGYVPQESFFFNASVRENLIWASPKAGEQDIWNACRLANADTFINALPEKLDTIIGDRGIRLSGGQRQRLSLARAIIRKPDILILDEATSSLDTESEKLIQQSVDSLARKMTIVIIAHRLSTISKADYV